MLGRLDDQMDRRVYGDAANALSAAIGGEPVRGLTLNETQSLSQQQSQRNSMVGLRPPLDLTQPRASLSTVVSELVNQWSLAFLDLARSGDGPAMLLVAQMYLVQKGYGRIKYNRNEGVQWLMRAAEVDEGEARELAKKLCPAEYSQWIEARMQRGEHQLIESEERAAKIRAAGDAAPSERRANAARAEHTSQRS